MPVPANDGIGLRAQRKHQEHLAVIAALAMGLVLRILNPPRNVMKLEPQYESFVERATIDVSLVAGRRPELLLRTLSSFYENMLKHFHVRKAIVNIDPVFGGKEDEKECVSILHHYFTDVSINTPSQPNFCEAVIHTWSRIEAKYALHLEDDWELNCQVDGSILLLFDKQERVRQVSFNTAEKKWDVRRLGSCHFQRRRIRVLGIGTPGKYKFPVFTTSPSFIERGFAHNVGHLLRREYDPEKQMRRQVNPSLERYLKRYKNLVVGEHPDYMISDIGREWRSARGIQKEVVGARSVWTRH